MISASGKAIKMKTISWRGAGGEGGGTVTALFKRGTTKLRFLSKLNIEPGCREEGLKT